MELGLKVLYAVIIFWAIVILVIGVLVGHYLL
jgi:hypothetical protein